MARSLVPILATIWATRELVVPITNNPIMLGRSIQLLRHLKHQNLSIGADLIFSSGIIFVVSFFATIKAVALLAHDPIMSGTLIWLFKHPKHKNLSSGDDFI